MQKTEFSNPKFYSMMAFDDLTEWLNTGGYEKKNLILQAFSICDKKKLQLYIDDYLIFLSKLVQEDLFKAYECTKYIWVQTSAIATQKGLNDWTIYIINHKYYQALNNVKTTNEIFEICRHALLEYYDAMDTYNKEKNYSSFIRDICRYIKESLPDSLTISEIAKAHNFSESYLAHCFKKETGTSIGKYIMNEKIKLAQDMITKEIPYLEITHRLGFSSQSHFSRQFKKLINMTPSEYKAFIRQSNVSS